MILQLLPHIRFVLLLLQHQDTRQHPYRLDCHRIHHHQYRSIVMILQGRHRLDQPNHRYLNLSIQEFLLGMSNPIHLHMNLDSYLLGLSLIHI